MSGTIVIFTPGNQPGEKKEWKGSKTPDYKTLRDLIGGLIQPVKVRYEGVVRQAYVDDEGLLKGLKNNPKAAELVAAYYGCPIHQIQEFVGTIVVWVPDKKVKNG